ncbi:hypothetical protein K7X08_005114 [Anisodus acutangulus]|uniref:Uncharacterized protein n=1 Tax=Anisodus acutangulus TaxID=402998 RepID=A0A9Q1MI54_9SOLA|nr:hypothetical protein K7X08_005114 [Anisodus acutangulus]
MGVRPPPENVLFKFAILDNYSAHVKAIPSWNKLNFAHQVFGEKSNGKTEIVVDVETTFLSSHAMNLIPKGCDENASVLINNEASEMLATQAKKKICHSVLDETKEGADFPLPQYSVEPPVYDSPLLGGEVCLLTMFLRVIGNSRFCAASDDLDHDKFITSTLWNSCNWIDTGQERNLPGFLLSKSRDLDREEKIQGGFAAFAARYLELIPYLMTLTVSIRCWLNCLRNESAATPVFVFAFTSSVVAGHSIFVNQAIGLKKSQDITLLLRAFQIIGDNICKVFFVGNVDSGHRFEARKFFLTLERNPSSLTFFIFDSDPKAQKEDATGFAFVHSFSFVLNASKRWKARSSQYAGPVMMALQLINLLLSTKSRIDKVLIGP